MTTIIIEQNGHRHTLSTELQMHGMGLVWDLFVNSKNPAAKHILEEIHALLGAMYYGKVDIKDGDPI